MILPGFNQLVQSRHGVMLVNSHDVYIGRSLAIYGEYSEAETRLFSLFVKPGMKVLDVGANIGAFVVPLAKMVGPTGHVYAFEPQRIVFQALCANAAINSLTNISAWNVGVGRTAGLMYLPKFDYNRDNNFGGVELTADMTGDRVQIVTIDEMNFGQCDFIKIDVEGMELDVLKGARKTLEQFHPIIYLENNQGNNNYSLFKFMHDIGYVGAFHEPHLYDPNNFAGNTENVFGNIANQNMLYAPTDSPLAESMKLAGGIPESMDG